MLDHTGRHPTDAPVSSCSMLEKHVARFEQTATKTLAFGSPDIVLRHRDRAADTLLHGW